MPEIRSHLALLAPRSADAFLADAVALANADELPGLVDAAVALRAVSGVRAAVRRCADLPSAAVQRLLQLDGAAFDEAVRPLLRGSADAARHALRLAGQRGRATLLPHIALMLGTELGSAAAATLLQVTVRRLCESGTRRPRDADADAIDEALATALRSEREHRHRPAVLAAAIACGRPGPRLAAVLNDPDALAASTLRSVVQALDHPLVRPNLLRWLSVEPLRASVQRRWRDLTAAEQFNDALRDHHLLLAPRRRRALRGMDRPLRCLPDPAIACRLNARAQRALPLLGEHLPLRWTTRADRLAEMIALPDAPARLRALLTLAAMGTGRDALRALQALCHDVDARVAATAARRLVGPGATAHGTARDAHDEPDQACAGSTAPAIDAALAVSAHRRLARPAQARLARCDAAAFQRCFGLLTDGQRVAAARALQQRAPAALDAALHTLIRHSPRESALAAIRLTMRMGVGDRLVDALNQLVRGRDLRRASAAVRALGEVDAPAAHAIILEAADHHDPRIRANAVEAAGRVAVRRQRAAALGTSAPSRAAAHGASLHAATAASPLHAALLGALEDADNRSRANAVRALTMTDHLNARDRLAAMLRDDRAPHRVSGLWVAKRAAMVDLAPFVARLADDDPTPHIRSRARVALQWLARSPATGAPRETNIPKPVPVQLHGRSAAAADARIATPAGA